jgi:hypothetical protein
MGFLDLFRTKSPRAKFAQKFIQAVRAQGEARPMHFDERQFIIRVGEKPDAPDNIYALHNVFALCARAPSSEHEQLIRAFVASLTAEELPEDYATARARLYVSMKDRTYPQLQGLRHSLDFPHAKKPATALAQSAVGGDLIACLVYDSEQSMMFVNTDSLAKWGVPMEQALADALANMRTNLEWSLVEDNGLYRSGVGDTYDGARMLFVDAIRGLPLRGAPVALVPDRETLLIAGSEDLDALGRMAALGRKRFEEADRPVSGRAVTLQAAGWATFEAPAAVAPAFGSLGRLYAARYFNEQKEVLETHFERAGEDIFVATLQVAQRDDSEEYHTWTTWTRNVVSLLPQADQVALYDNEAKTMAMARWTDLARVMGSRLEATEYLPARWKVSGFPSTSDLAAMGAVPTPVG